MKPPTHLLKAHQRWHFELVARTAQLHDFRPSKSPAHDRSSPFDLCGALDTTFLSSFSATVQTSSCVSGGASQCQVLLAHNRGGARHNAPGRRNAKLCAAPAGHPRSPHVLGGLINFRFSITVNRGDSSRVASGSVTVHLVPEVRSPLQNDSIVNQSVNPDGASSLISSNHQTMPLSPHRPARLFFLLPNLSSNLTR